VLALSVLGVLLVPLIFLLGTAFDGIAYQLGVGDLLAGMDSSILYLLAAAPNLGFLVTGLGAFASAGLEVTGSGVMSDRTIDEMARLSFPWVLLATVASLLVVGIASSLALKGAVRGTLLRHIISWLGAVVVLVPTFAAMANLSASFSSSGNLGEDSGRGTFSAAFGLSVGGVTVMLFLVALVLSPIIGVLKGLIDPNEVAEKAQAGYAKAQAASANAYNQAPAGSEAADPNQPGPEHRA
jgi:hypothetical protein